MPGQAAAGKSSRGARAPRAPARRRAGRACLCETDLTERALALVERDGFEALTMRALAKELGVEAMSLYSHVESKEVLLGRMGAFVMESVPEPPRGLAPRTRLFRLAQGLRGAARRYPRSFPIAVLHPQVLASAVRPTEVALQAFLDAGLPDARAMRSQRVFLSFVRGYVLWELGGFAVGTRDPDGRPSARVLAEIEQLDAERYPQVRRLAPRLAQVSGTELFEEGLRLILDSLLPRARAGKGRA
ncbi:MAG: TetR/AcrR family transcriptional regulator [Phycisphaerales bacterium]